MSRGRWPASEEADAIARAIGWGAGALQHIDRLISRYGALRLAADVVRAEAGRTDHKVGEDAPISDGAHENADAATHGGDGNSGECDHAAETAAEDRDAPESACDAGALGDTPDGRGHETAGDDADGGTPECSGPSAHDAGQPTDRGDHGADEVTEGMGSRPIDDHFTPADDEPVGTRCPAEGGVESVDGNLRAPQDSGDAGAPESDFQGAFSRGGGAVKVSPTLARVTEVARIARALSRLMSDATRPDPSPLWDGKRVVRELVTRQVRIHRMRRDVHAVKGLLVLYDVSGSCAWIADRTWGIASALASRYAGLLAAPTSSCAGAEGSLDPREIVGRTARMYAGLPPITGYGDDVERWRMIRAAGVSHMLVLGDAHGTPGYRAASEAGIRVLWANPNAHIAPRDTAWCVYTLIRDDDIASAVETLAQRVYA
jgi:hypothetical protein